jgi:hypothetical protein
MRQSAQGNEGRWEWLGRRVLSPPSRPKRLGIGRSGSGCELSFYRLPNAHEAAIVATLSDTRPKRPSARTTASSSAGDDTELFSAFDVGAGLIICNNKVLRPIRRFCLRRSRPCYPNSFGAGSHRIETISASAVAPEPERTENINVAVASTTRATWPGCRTRLLVLPPRGASSQFSARALPILVNPIAGRRSKGTPAMAPIPDTGNATFARKRAPLEVLRQIRRRDSAYI